MDMSTNATKDDLQALGKDLEFKIDKKIDKAVAELSDIISALAQSMHNEIVELKQEHKEIRASIDRLISTIDGFVARIDHYETEQAARDNQFEKLLVWARKVSEKTGVPLENL